MLELARLMLILCINDYIPNPYTVDNLPKHQRNLIYKTAEETCSEKIIKQYGLEINNPECREVDTCM